MEYRSTADTTVLNPVPHQAHACPGLHNTKYEVRLDCSRNHNRRSQECGRASGGNHQSSTSTWYIVSTVQVLVNGLTPLLVYIRTIVHPYAVVHEGSLSTPTESVPTREGVLRITAVCTAVRIYVQVLLCMIREYHGTAVHLSYTEYVRGSGTQKSSETMVQSA